MQHNLPVSHRSPTRPGSSPATNKGPHRAQEPAKHRQAAHGARRAGLRVGCCVYWVVVFIGLWDEGGQFRASSTSCSSHSVYERENERGQGKGEPGLAELRWVEGGNCACRGARYKVVAAAIEGGVEGE